MDIYLIRHTRIDVEPGVCYGQSDIDVPGTFPQDCKKVAAKLPAGYQAFEFFSSPLKRCYKLASALSNGAVHTDERLKELDFGDWELQKWDDLEGKQVQQWMDDFVNVACPGGESYRQMNDRVIEWWNETVEQDFRSVAVVTHAGVIRSLLSHILEIPYSNSFRLTIDWGHIAAVSVSENNCIVKFVNR